jgi:hypothetical protein
LTPDIGQDTLRIKTPSRFGVRHTEGVIVGRRDDLRQTVGLLRPHLAGGINGSTSLRNAEHLAEPIRRAEGFTVKTERLKRF